MSIQTLLSSLRFVKALKILIWSYVAIICLRSALYTGTSTLRKFLSTMWLPDTILINTTCPAVDFFQNPRQMGNQKSSKLKVKVCFSKLSKARSVVSLVSKFLDRRQAYRISYCSLRSTAGQITPKYYVSGSRNLYQRYTGDNQYYYI